MKKQVERAQRKVVRVVELEAVRGGALEIDGLDCSKVKKVQTAS